MVVDVDFGCFILGWTGMSDSQVDESDDLGSRDEEEDELSDEESEEAIPPARKVRKAAQVARLSWTGKQPKTAQMISRKESGYSQASELLYDYQAVEPEIEHFIGKTDHKAL
jgi:hypothetical protein